MRFLHLGNTVFNIKNIEKVKFFKRYCSHSKKSYTAVFCISIDDNRFLKHFYDKRPVEFKDPNNLKRIQDLDSCFGQNLKEAIRNEMEYYYHFDYENFDSFFKNNVFLYHDTDFEGPLVVMDIEYFNEAEIITKSGGKSVFGIRKDYEKIKREFNEFKISE